MKGVYGIRSALWRQISDLVQGDQRRSYLFTFVIEFVNLLSGLVTLRLVAYLLGTVGFGEYAVARRAISVLNFPLLLGLGISLPRYVALVGSSSVENNRQNAYFVAGFIIAVPILLMFSIAGVMLTEVLARLFYGDVTFSYMIFPIMLATVGLYLQTMLYGYFRGQLRMWPANGLQFLNIGLVPLVAVMLSGRSASTSIAYTGLGWLVISFVVGARVACTIPVKELTGALLKKCVRELITYGLPRVPGEFALFGLFAVPTFIVADRLGVENAGFFSFSLSLLQLISSMFATPGILLLPYVSRLAGEQRWDRIKRVVFKTLLGSGILILLMVALFEVTASVLIPLLMGESFSAAVEQSRWIMLGAVPYVVYMILRSPLDALTQWPHNSVNLSFALVIAVGTIWLGSAYISAPVAMLLALVLLGFLSVISWERSIKKTPPDNFGGVALSSEPTQNV